ncbi:MAG: hypothetical protein AMXMBFR76_15740 [Pseudomonadota bacterium]
MGAAAIGVSGFGAATQRRWTSIDTASTRAAKSGGRMFVTNRPEPTTAITRRRHREGRSLCKPVARRL